MTRRKSGGHPELAGLVKVRICGQPLHSEIPKSGMADMLEKERSAALREMLSPEQYVSRGIMKLSQAGSRAEGVMILSDAINEGLDVSDAIPLLKKYLQAMEQAIQGISVSIIMFHHFNNEDDAEILAFLRHENPRIARAAADYMAVRALTGFSVSLFVPELIRMIYHEDADVARSAFNAVGAAAILGADEIAALYIRSIYSQDSGVC
jgi:hypothetical protein